MPAVHAPAGGVKIRGVQYTGGQFIPSDVVDTLTPDEKQQVGLQKPAAGKTNGQASTSETEFVNTYFDRDNAFDRAGEAVEKMNDPDFDFSIVDDDTKQAVAEDLANWSTDPADMNALAEGAIHESWDSDRVDIISRALELAPEGKAPPFDPNEHTYSLFDMDREEADWGDTLYPQMARHAGIVWQSPDGKRFVVQNDGKGPAGSGGLEMGSWGVSTSQLDLDSEEALQSIFDDLPNPTVREEDAPKSARNTGRVSGGENVEIEDDWHPNNVDVFKPMNNQFFLLRRGEHSYEVYKGGPKYEIVDRSNTGQRVGLPPQYWEGLSATDPGSYDEKRTDKKAYQQGKTDALRGEVRTHKQELKQFARKYGELKDRANRLMQSTESFTQHEQKAGQESAEVTAYWSGSTGTPTREMGDSLIGLLDDVYQLPVPEAPEMTTDHVKDLLTEATRDAEDTNPVYAANQIRWARDRARTGHESGTGAMDEWEQLHREHMDELRGMWSDTLDHAKDAVRHFRNYDPAQDEKVEAGSGLDPGSARLNLKLALSAAQLAKRQIRKLDRRKAL